MDDIQRIYLIGMMGSGKSTIAKALAQRLNWIWMDTDACVETKRGMPASDVFGMCGEEEFRKTEWECVKEMGKFKEVVVACGGGAPCFHNAMNEMLSTGIVIYLSTRVETLVKRVKSDITLRPLIAPDKGTPGEVLSQLLKQREPVYIRAHHTIRTDDKSVEAIVDEAVSVIRSRARLNQ